MEKKNIGLKGLVAILFLLVFGLGGYIIYDKIYNLQNNNNKTENNASILYENTDIDKETLDELYYIIGALPTKDEEVLAPRHCLNVAVTNTNYMGIPYANDVFSWYVITYNKEADYEKYKDATIYVDDGNIKVSAYNCASCFTIEKTEAEKFKSLYSFGMEEKFDFIKDNVENYDNIYGATQSLGSPVHCDYNVTHNIIETHVEKGTMMENIYITDKQTITKYDDFDNNIISQLTNQTVIYVFSKSVDGDSYSLSRVIHRAKYN